jgi:hypothetical protein
VGRVWYRLLRLRRVPRPGGFCGPGSVPEDDPFGHPRFSYQPDGNFACITLDFDITWQGIQAFESKKSAWTDWATLNCLKADNSTDNNSLMALVTTAPTGRTGASGVFTLNSGIIVAGQRVTLWYLCGVPREHKWAGDLRDARGGDGAAGLPQFGLRLRDSSVLVRGPPPVSGFKV